jgi:indole-3-glycerol phosphate synthase
MILNDILIQKRKDLEELKSRFSLHRLKEATEAKKREGVRSFRKALSSPKNLNLICELKKASPTEGVIREDFQPLRIASYFEHAGAAAISVLTETHYFKGRPSYLKTVRQVTHIPILRKDFIFETYQLYESALLEADAFLLIASILTESELKNLIQLGLQLQMDALVEVHTDEELKKALDAGAKIIGINNRDLKSLSVDPHRAKKLLPHIPKGIITVIESGFTKHEELLEYKSLGVNTFLIGTTIMKSPDIVAKIEELLGKDKRWKK